MSPETDMKTAASAGAGWRNPEPFADTAPDNSGIAANRAIMATREGSTCFMTRSPLLSIKTERNTPANCPKPADPV